MYLSVAKQQWNTFLITFPEIVLVLQKLLPIFIQPRNFNNGNSIQRVNCDLKLSIDLDFCFVLPTSNLLDSFWVFEIR